jgi:hypothetical protein
MLLVLTGSSFCPAVILGWRRPHTQLIAQQQSCRPTRENRRKSDMMRLHRMNKWLMTPWIYNEEETVWMEKK